MDYEVFGGVSTNDVNNIARTFLETVKNLTGKEVMLYSDLSNSRSRFGREIANEYALWLAYYQNESTLQNIENNWEVWQGWQYTDRGKVDGINGYVDRDIFTENVLLSDISSNPQVENPNDTINTESINYTIKRGDTLSSIANRYGTTVQEIVNINNIQNPNLIYPGQVIRILTNSTVHGNEDRGTGDIIYTVRRGNTLSQIANAYGVSVQHIVELNNISNPNLIYPGQKLRITESNKEELNPLGGITYTVKRGDTLYRIARYYRVSINQLVRLNNIQNPNLIYPDQVLKINRNFHLKCNKNFIKK